MDALQESIKHGPTQESSCEYFILHLPSQHERLDGEAGSNQMEVIYQDKEFCKKASLDRKLTLETLFLKIPERMNFKKSPGF